MFRCVPALLGTLGVAWLGCLDALAPVWSKGSSRVNKKGTKTLGDGAERLLRQ